MALSERKEKQIMVQPQGKRLAIVSQKGGTGKTVVSVNVSIGLAKEE